MKRILISFAILIAIVAGILLVRRNVENEANSPRKEAISTPSVQASPSTAAVVPEQTVDVGSSEASAVKTVEAESKEGAKKRIVDLSPTPDEYRREVARNPHGLPRSYLVFAQELAEKFDAAVANPSKGSEFIEELVECVKSPELRKIIAVPTVCLANIRRYGEKVPSFRNETDAIYRNADAVLKN